MFLVNSSASRFYAPQYYWGPLLANVREQFAEFLMDNSPIALVYSTRPLELVLVQFSYSIFFLGSLGNKRQIRTILTSWRDNTH